MIIFDLDGTLADCQHRRHFVERYHPINEKKRLSEISLEQSPAIDPNYRGWRPDWKAFYEACDKDKVIFPVKSMLVQNAHRDISIWSGRCESVRKKTILWIYDHTELNDAFIDSILKMRPIGDYTPDDVLKERWLTERCSDHISAQIKGHPFGIKHGINFVFDSDPDSIKMWRRRGIFVFDCNQDGREF